jgi:multidrug efflux pump subunit AcrA (membrane-fusion protein)
MFKKLTRAQILMIAVFIAAIAYFGFRVISNKDDGKLRASGTIEAVEVNVSSETSGKVKEVLIDEGQAAKTGDPLLNLDDSLMVAQRAVAAAQLDTANAGVASAQNALKTAKSQYQIALEAALAQDRKTRVQDWFSKDTNQFNQPDWYFSRAEQLKAAQTEVDIALKALEDASGKLENVNTSLGKSDFLNAEKRLLEARVAYLMAKNVNSLAQNSTDGNAPVGRYNATHCGTNDGYQVDQKQLTNFVYGCRGDEHLAEAGDNLYNAANKELTDSQAAYDALLNTSAADEVLQARADVSVAQERYYASLDFLRGLQTGEQSENVTAANGAMEQAQAAVEQAQKAAQQAQANLDLLDAQMAKLIIYAPMNGVVLARNVDPGEFIQPGGAALTMADLNELTTTVYVPEDRYGEIHLGQTVDLTVDSFPGEIFTATVLSISDQAEFTPRNVQTVAGRSATVYAVKLQVNDPDDKLKLGMPADVVFIK